MDQNNYIFEVEDLCKYFPAGKKKVVKAVDGINLKIRKGETIGLVGESGCGKTTCGRTCIGIYDRTEGEVLYRGENIHEMNASKKKEFTKKVQMIFQDPYSSLDPRMKVHDIIAEGMRIHKMVKSKAEEIEEVQKLLKSVGLNEEHARQRIGIARALAVNPEFLLCDEPISALDVSVQAQVVNLLIKLQKERSLTSMFIAHDLSMVKHISDRVGVMYLGNVVELAPSEELYKNPQHPYTKALLSAIPIPDSKVARGKQQIRLEGEVPSPVNPPDGCHFCGRCPYATEKCKSETPKLKEIAPGHFVACHLY